MWNKLVACHVIIFYALKSNMQIIYYIKISIICLENNILSIHEWLRHKLQNIIRTIFLIKDCIIVSNEKLTIIIFIIMKYHNKYYLRVYY